MSFPRGIRNCVFKTFPHASRNKLGAKSIKISIDGINSFPKKTGTKTSEIDINPNTKAEQNSVENLKDFTISLLLSSIFPFAIRFADFGSIT